MRMRRILTVACVLCWCGSAWAETVAELRQRYNEAYLAVLAAASSVEASLGNVDSGFSYLTSCGWKVQSFADKTKKLQTFYTLAENVTPSGRKVYLLTFKGSTSKKDWGINFQTGQVRFGGSSLAEMRRIAALPSDESMPAVHGGFNFYTDHVLKSIVLDETGTCLQGVFWEVLHSPNAVLILAGHSLGGAVATLLGERLYDLGLPPERLKVITFGAPAIGNRAFAEQLGQRLDLVRYTNTADPVPGALQTVFGGYKQFGENRKYHIDVSVNDSQHDSALYLDYAVSAYYKAMDALSGGLGRPVVQLEQMTAGVPKVGLVVFSSPEADKYKYVPDIRRFVTGQYLRTLPSYRLLRKDLDWDRSFASSKDIFDKAKQTGCEYVLFCGIDGHKERNSKAWYVDLTQTLYTADHRLLTMGNYARKVSPASGNILAAGENLLLAKADLRRALSFLRPQGRVNLLDD